jgi:hypothetical protein
LKSCVRNNHCVIHHDERVGHYGNKEVVTVLFTTWVTAMCRLLLSMRISQSNVTMMWSEVDILFQSLNQHLAELENKIEECNEPTKKLLRQRDQLGRGQCKKHLFYMKHYFTNKLTEMILVANKMCYDLKYFVNQNKIAKLVTLAPCPQLNYKATHCGHTWGFLGHLNWTIQVICLVRRKLWKLGSALEAITLREFHNGMHNYYNRALRLEKWIDIVNQLICVYDIESIFNTPAYRDEAEMNKHDWYNKIRKDVDKEIFQEEEEHLAILVELGERK